MWGSRWAPLHFKGSYWNVAEDELDVIAAYYRLQARCAARAAPLWACTLMLLSACACAGWKPRLDLSESSCGYLQTARCTVS